MIKKMFRSFRKLWFKIESFLTSKLAFALVLLMMASDFYTIRDLFISVNTNLLDAAIYAFVAAVVLEGLPSYMGIVLGRRMDKARYENNDAGLISVFLAFIITCFMAVLVGGLRYQWVQEQIRLGAMGGRRGNEEIYGQYFLMVLPALTSMTAFLISWFTMRNRCLDTKFEEVRALQREFYEKEAEFRIAQSRCMEARTTVWTSVCDQVEEMPPTMEGFRRECFQRLRGKLVDNCLTAYPTQIERYTADVEAKLQGYLLEISKHTTLPHTITDINLTKLIQQHDKEAAMDVADCWNYNLAGPDLEAELRRTIDNAVVVAQYKSALNPYYLEKDR